MDDKGQVIETVRLQNKPDDLIIGCVDRLLEDSKIAIEATGNWYYFYELLDGKSPEIHLAHVLKTRAIAEARIKTDKIDSTILAHLLRTDLLPESYIPRRDIREVLRYRASLVSLRTALKNRIHTILSKNGIIVEHTNVLGLKAKAWLKALEVRSCYRLGIDGYVRLTETLQQLIDAVTKTIEVIVENNPQAKQLTTIHGIGYY
jgi:transposase